MPLERMLLTTGQELGSQADLFPADIDEIGHQTPKERSSQGSSRTVSGSSGSSDYCEAEPSVTPLHAQQRLCMVGREIREVWRHNLHEEMLAICQLVAQFPFVAMDTEFPGVVIYPTNSCENEDYGYQLVKGNVDLLKLIQLGITLFDSGGHLPEGVCTWQFNFKFDIETDMYAEESISLLQNSGLQFEQHREHGIAPHDFAELMLSSGLVLSDSVTWLTFHSAYDFSYLLTQLTSLDLPSTEAEFKELIRLYFPHIYDIKYLMLFTDNLIGGLQSVANYLNVERFGTQHQAGSDSLLTGQVFFRMYTKYFSEGLDSVKFSGQIAGFKSPGWEPSAATQAKREAEEQRLCAELEDLHNGSSSPMRDH